MDDLFLCILIIVISISLYSLIDIIARMILLSKDKDIEIWKIKQEIEKIKQNL